MRTSYKLWVTADPTTGDLDELALRTARMASAAKLTARAGLVARYDPSYEGDLALMVLSPTLSALTTLATQLEQWHGLVIDCMEVDAAGDEVELQKAQTVEEWIEALRAGMTQRVHVISFSPGSEQVGSGGFDWCPSLEDAKKVLVKRLAEVDEEDGLLNVALVHVDVPAILTREEVTAWLGARLDMFEPRGMLGYREPVAA